MKTNVSKNRDVYPERTQELLIQTGKRLFASKGFDGVTIREIAEQAKVNFSLIRYYFGDKEGLYRACLALYGKARLESAQKILVPVASTDEFRIRLKMIIQEIIDSVLRDPDLSRMMLREVESEYPLATDVLRETVVKMAQAFVEFFSSAQKAGILRKNLSPLFLTQIMQLTLSHLVLTDETRGRFFNMSIKNSKNRDALVENLYTLILNGVLQTEEL